MKAPGSYPSPQLVIVARLAEYWQFRRIRQHESDTWEFMLRKLLETEEPIAALKEEMFQAARDRLLDELGKGGIAEGRCADYKLLFERLLSPNDFTDVAIHLFPGVPNQAEALRQALAQARPTHLFIEEGKPAGQRSPAWDKLVGEIYGRLELDLLGTVMVRKPATAQRRAMVLRRIRRNVAEYCSVVRIPTDPKETFTPFILTRLEALIAANLRFLRRYR